MDVSVIIVTYNSYQMTNNCIQSVINMTSGISYEILVVDNASSDCSKNEFEKDGRIQYLYNENNLGFGRANNLGITQATGRNVIFLNNDTILKNNALKILSDYLDQHAEVGACGGNLFNKDGIPIHSFFRYYPSIYEELNILFGRLPDRLIFGRNLEHNYSKKPLEVKHITGADLMVKKKVLDKIGGFNPLFFMYYEDTELSYRIRKKGLKIISLPDAEIIHLVNTTIKRYYDERRFMKLMAESKNQYYKLTHSDNYLKAVKFIQRTNYMIKKHAPVRSVRERWRERGYYLYDQTD